MAADYDKELLLMIGRTVYGEIVFQLYDVENDEWYVEKIVPDKKLSSSQIDTAFCLIGTKLYFTVQSDANEDNETEICTFDLVSEKITHLGVKCSYSGKFVAIKNRIYFICSFEQQLWYFDTKKHKLEICADIDDYYSPRSIQTMNGLIYILGQKLINRFEKGKILNPRTNEQKDMSDLPNYFTKPSKSERIVECTELNGKICAVNNDSLAMIFVYTPDEDVWETIVVRNDPIFENGKLTSCNGRLVGTCMNCFINVYNFDNNEWKCIRDYNGSMVNCRIGIAVPKSIFNC